VSLLLRKYESILYFRKTKAVVYSLMYEYINTHRHRYKKNPTAYIFSWIERKKNNV